MNKKAFGLALFSVIVWGSAFAAIRASLLGGYSPGHLVLFRFLIASSIFIIYALWPGTSFRLPRKEDIGKILLLGWIGISVYQLGITFGEETVSASTAGMMIASAPIFTALIAIFALKERLSAFGWVGLLVGMLGTFLIMLGSGEMSFAGSKGIVYILIAVLATSAFFVYQKPLFQRYRPIELTAYFTWAGTLPFFIFFPGLVEGIQAASFEANMSAIYVGIFPAAIAYVAWATALSLSDAGVVTSVMYVEPVFAIIVASLWLHEVPGILSLIGATIAIGSVVIVNWVGKKEPPVLHGPAEN
ncbi:DMT family transporter [Sporosarcina sp. 179-K 3D1 HS]